ncbi:hypothetical protein LEP1GSC021_3179 [Leptospira noguchii str. 1993005606]|nr:hypothetical protein LEP1GSC021_3179 [Leptospira noguchii str. 1993005606]
MRTKEETQALYNETLKEAVSIRFLCEQRKKHTSHLGTSKPRECFNPLPLRTKEETAAQKPRKDV